MLSGDFDDVFDIINKDKTSISCSQCFGPYPSNIVNPESPEGDVDNSLLAGKETTDLPLLFTSDAIAASIDDRITALKDDFRTRFEVQEGQIRTLSSAIEALRTQCATTQQTASTISEKFVEQTVAVERLLVEKLNDLTPLLEIIPQIKATMDEQKTTKSDLSTNHKEKMKKQISSEDADVLSEAVKALVNENKRVYASVVLKEIESSLTHTYANEVVLKEIRLLSQRYRLQRRRR